MKEILSVVLVLSIARNLTSMWWTALAFLCLNAPPMTILVMGLWICRWLCQGFGPLAIRVSSLSEQIWGLWLIRRDLNIWEFLLDDHPLAKELRHWIVRFYLWTYSLEISLSWCQKSPQPTQTHTTWLWAMGGYFGPNWDISFEFNNRHESSCCWHGLKHETLGQYRLGHHKLTIYLIICSNPQTTVFLEGKPAHGSGH